jgi:hypothetical protein
MKIRHSRILLSVVITISLSAVLFMPGLTGAGDMEPPGSPGPTMHSLDEIYNKLDMNYTNYPARVEKTGQRTSYATGDDGDLQKGVSWPDPRFTDNGNGTVTDNMTGLIWLKDANRFGTKSWATALSECNTLADDGVDLTDGSSAGDWRLPNVKELISLIDYDRYNPPLPSGHPFINVQGDWYGSSTTYAGDTTASWRVSMGNKYVLYSNKQYGYYVWPIRDGN